MMARAACDDNTFILTVNDSPTLDAAAATLGVRLRNVYARMRSIEARYGAVFSRRHPGIGLVGPVREASHHPIHYDHPYTAVLFTDAHFWPGEHTPAFWLLLQIIEALQPEVVINNGDAFDGASVSRHPRIRWSEAPTVRQELDACVEALGLIASTAQGADLLWNLGNHDLRMEGVLSQRVPEFQGVQGFRLEDHFPDWQIGWSCSLNDVLFCCHNYKGGKHAGYNNARDAQVSMATGHDHMLKITPHTGLVRTVYGIHGGTLAEPWGPQFGYAMNRPRDWQAGFVVVRVDGEQIYPEKIEVTDGKAWFRGKLWVA